MPRANPPVYQNVQHRPALQVSPMGQSEGATRRDEL